MTVPGLVPFLVLILRCLVPGVVQTLHGLVNCIYSMRPISGLGNRDSGCGRRDSGFEDLVNVGHEVVSSFGIRDSGLGIRGSVFQIRASGFGIRGPR